MKKKVILIGAFLETIELVLFCGFEIEGIIDDNYEGSFAGIKILCKESEAYSLYKRYKDCELVCTPDNPKVKEKIFSYYHNIGYKFATVISPRAIVSMSAFISEGAIIQSGVNISSNAHIGKLVKLNFNCNVMHDVSIEDFTVLAPDVTLLGRSKVGKCSYLAARTIIEHDAEVPAFTRTELATLVKKDL